MSIEAAFFGTLGRDAEPKTSQAGKSYLRLSVRVGNDDAAQWVSVLSFDARALEVADKLVKGARVYVEGTLSTNEWIGSDGAKRFGLSVMSWHTRLTQIGRNRPKRERSDDRASVAAGRTYRAPEPPPDRGEGFHDDKIPF